MGKTTTLNLRVEPEVKQEAEAVLKRLGIPMATAIDMYLRQIVLTGGIPFALTLPENQARNFAASNAILDPQKEDGSDCFAPETVPQPKCWG